jgi:CHAT domain-containing protein
LNLKLNADLVVLSACDTALGKIEKGEGMIGLTWALFVAGVPNTVVSQWTVDSSSTTELMIQFHKKLKLLLSDSTSRTPIPDALRAAALNLLKTDEYRHPFYWAPFVVIGSGELATAH